MEGESQVSDKAIISIKDVLKESIRMFSFVIRLMKFWQYICKLVIFKSFFDQYQLSAFVVFYW